MSFAQLKEKYYLRELELNQKISDGHIQKFCSSHGGKWKLMPAPLDLKSIVAEDIDCAPNSEEEKRLTFFSTWKQVKGSSATYKALITALLEVDCIEDAESVCELVPPTGTINTSVQSVDPTVKQNLKCVLRQNWEDIQYRYASYVSCLCQRVEQTGVSVEDFCFYVISSPVYVKKELCELFAHAKEQLHKEDTIIGIFNILSKERTSFLDCEIFLSIQEKYHIPIDCEELNYYKHLEGYVRKHKISEFIEINPKLQELTKNSEKIIVKFDMSVDENLDKLLNLKDRISAILGVLPGSLRLLSVEEGCVVATFLIPTQLAQIIFTSEKKFTSEEEQEFQALSVLWLECNHHKFVFGKEMKKAGERDEEQDTEKPSNTEEDFLHELLQLVEHLPTTEPEQDSSPHSDTMPSPYPSRPEQDSPPCHSIAIMEQCPSSNPTHMKMMVSAREMLAA